MRRPLRLLLSVALLLAAIAGGWVFLRPPLVTIVLVNASRKPVQWVQIAHRHGWPKVEEVQPLGAIPIGESRTVRYRSPGESEYDLTVHFADGSEVKGGAGYAEAGYRFTETISDTSIRSDPQLHRY